MNPYRLHPDASARVKVIEYECSDCGTLFEPLVTFDPYCDACWQVRQEVMLEDIARQQSETAGQN